MQGYCGEEKLYPVARHALLPSVQPGTGFLISVEEHINVGRHEVLQEVGRGKKKRT
jgi:hypothetical protein